MSRALSTVLCAGLFFLASNQLLQAPRLRAPAVLDTRLPLPLQIVSSGGDRYLAANAAALRSVMADYQAMDKQEYAVLAAVQKDAAWLNPAHEDNYYLAGTLLPWQGQLPAAQDILQRAMAARPDDYMPGFLYAFNQYHFHADVLGAAQSLQQSASRLSNAEDRVAMQSLAAFWLEQGVRPEAALAVMDVLIAQAQDAGFAAFLRERRAAMARASREKKS